MAMSRRDDGDSRSEIEEGISIGILNHRAAARFCNHRIVARV
jgi:hypothetical protein